MISFPTLRISELKLKREKERGKEKKKRNIV